MIISGDSILDFNLTDFFDSHFLNNSLLSFTLSREDQKFVNQRLSHLNSEIDINIYGLQNLSDSKDQYKSVVHKSKIYEEINKNNMREKEKGEKFRFTKKFLKNCKNFDLLYNYDDANVYMFDKKIYNILDDTKVKEINPMITDFVTYLINHYSSLRLRRLCYSNEFDEEHVRDSNLVKIEENIANPSKKLPKLKIVALILEKHNYI
jgi:hypothetical protein